MLTLDFLDRLGLPLKWAVIVAAAVVLGRLLSAALGIGEGIGAGDLLLGAVFGGIAGYVVGILRRRNGKTH